MLVPSSWLVAVGMIVASLPIVLLPSVALVVIGTIASMLDDQVMPVGVVFAVVPVMVVTMVIIVDSDLHTGFCGREAATITAGAATAAARTKIRM